MFNCTKKSSEQSEIMFGYPHLNILIQKNKFKARIRNLFISDFVLLVNLKALYVQILFPVIIIF